MSKKILAGDMDKSQPVLVDVFDGVVVFRNEIASKQNPEEKAQNPRNLEQTLGKKS